MKEIELRDLIHELEMNLLSMEFGQWVKKQSDEDKKKILSLSTELSTYRSQLDTHELKVLADKLDELAPELNNGIKAIQGEIRKMDNSIATIEGLGRIIGLVARTVSLIT